MAHSRFTGLVKASGYAGQALAGFAVVSGTSIYGNGRPPVCAEDNQTKFAKG